jgi:hypothetical protein
MGAVDFSLSSALVKVLQQALPIEVFVETGTFEGDTVAELAAGFKEVYSVELSPDYFAKALSRLEKIANVTLTLGDSREFLARLRPELSARSVLYYLDAHWCVAANTAGDRSQCPLLEEIAAIGNLGESSVILIDDARLFLAPPPEPHDVTQWPTFDEVVTALRRLSDRHEIMVVNDVISYFPRAIRGDVYEYARTHGVDWLRASQAVVENPVLRQVIEEKEGMIEEMERMVLEKEGMIEEMERSVLEKEGMIATMRKAFDDSQVHHQSRHRELAKTIEEKEFLIHTLQQALGATGGAARAGADDVTLQQVLMRDLEAKESVIQKQALALKAYRLAFAPLAIFILPLNYALKGIWWLWRRMPTGNWWPGRRMLGSLAPRLGVLRQHPPRELHLPAHYSKPAAIEQPPKISVVTPSFKHAAFIGRTIDSVLAQGYPNLEYHVQDGGSDDGTREILQGYGTRLTSWDSRPDGGQAEAINAGFARTTGDIMAYLNSDDILLPGALAYVAEYFRAHPEIQVVYGHRILIDENDRQIGRWVMPAHSDDVLSWADFVPQETLFWRRSIWEKAGGRMDESFRFALDWDLIVRFRSEGARFTRLPRFLGGFRVHPQQKTSAGISDIGFREMDRIRKRVLGRVPSKVEVRRAVFPYLLRHMALDLGWRIQDRLGMHS